MTNKTVTIPADTLTVLINAAVSWHDELDEYIIPNAEETSMEDASACHAESAAIHLAVGLARAAAREEN